MNLTLKNLLIFSITLAALASGCTKKHYVKKKSPGAEQPATAGGAVQPAPGGTPANPEPGVGPSGGTIPPGGSPPSGGTAPSGGQPVEPPTNPNTNPAPGTGSQPPLPPNPIIKNVPVQAIELLRLYCKGCHAIESYNLKFITSDLDSDVIKYILTAKTSKNVLWAEAIVRSLTWPNQQPPAEEDKTLMPIGGKRFQINGNNFNSSVTDRDLLIGKIQELIQKGP